MDSSPLGTVLIFFAAVLYSSVGHGGASAYLAAIALLGLSPAAMRPTILVLNIVVASIAFFNFARLRKLDLRRYAPLVIGSIPLAWLGGSISLGDTAYRVLLGLVLVFASFRLWGSTLPDSYEATPPPSKALLAVGGSIGFISGLTGVGGGIFLSPILILKRWALPKETAGVSAGFIVLNSLAGLLAVTAKNVTFSPALAQWAIAAVIGGLIGSHLGATRATSPTLRRLLSVVLAIAALKLLLS
jgi:uncharacterized membrane protein YfcA